MAQPLSDDAGRILFCVGNRVLSARPDGADEVILATADMAMRAAAQSADGAILVWVRGTTLIHHLHIVLGEAPAVHADVVRGRNEQFGPLGFRDAPRQLLYSAAGKMTLLDFDTGARTLVGLGDRPQWLGQGPDFIYETGSRPHDEEIGIHRTSADDEADEVVIPYGTHAVPSPDGAKIAYVWPAHDDDPRVYVRDMATGSFEQLEASTRFDRPIVLSRPGNRLLVNRADLASPDGTLRFDLMAFDLSTGGVTVLDSGATAAYEACFSPDGSSICFARADRSGSQLFIIDPAGQPMPFAAHLRDCRSPVWLGGS